MNIDRKYSVCERNSVLKSIRFFTNILMVERWSLYYILIDYSHNFNCGIHEFNFVSVTLISKVELFTEAFLIEQATICNHIKPHFSLGHITKAI